MFVVIRILSREVVAAFSLFSSHPQALILEEKKGNGLLVSGPIFNHLQISGRVCDSDSYVN